MTTISFELMSPERLLVSRAVGMVIVPGVEGDMGVMPGHAPTISTLRPGVVNVFENGSLTDRIFVAGGFAEITPERCTVMAARWLISIRRPSRLSKRSWKVSWRC
jgi:F-type H+-transporting ATPase subunit epsilon